MKGQMTGLIEHINSHQMLEAREHLCTDSGVSFLAAKLIEC
jgi:hypothetical protein